MVKISDPKAINLTFQFMLIKKSFPNWHGSVYKNQLICQGSIKPSEISKTYLIEILYKLKDSPKIKLIDPLIQENFKGERAPHLYPDDRLCVYHPRFCEWDSSKSIATTIIPWVSLWLYFYEVWLMTGEWKGEGVHPPKKS